MRYYMNIPIYEKEINDNLGEKILASNSLAYASLVSAYVPSEEDQEDIKKLLASDKAAAENKGQFDLYYLKSILVSTGWNKNDDVFDSKEIWEARNSPEDKQFNFMHNEADIIGHITGSTVVDTEGKELEDQNVMPSSDFEIRTSAVLYNSWTDSERKERMRKIIAGIEAGEWFVSMEALFNNFDYAVISPDGNNKVIARDEESAFLTKHLRAYGGEGQYEGYRVGRLLRNINFSGKGLVSNPANPRSVILDGGGSRIFSFAGVNETKLISESNIKEISDMSDNVLENQVAELKEELAIAKEAAEALRTEVANQKDEEFQSRIEAFEATVAEKEQAIAETKEALEAITAKVTELEEAIASKDEELAAANEKIEAHEAEKKTLARKSMLLEVGLEGEEAEAALEKFAEASDEMFGEIVQVIAAGTPGKKPPKPMMAEDKPKKDDEEKDEKELPPFMKKKGEGPMGKKPKAAQPMTGKKPKAGVEEEVETEEVEADFSEEVLEEVEVEAEASLTDVGEDAVLETRTAASAWLESNVLRSTAKVQE